MSIVFNALMAMDEADSDAARIKVGFVGTAGDTYLQLGMAAMKFDSVAISMEILELEDEATAKQMLEKGGLAAYIVIPEGFMENAFQGNMMKLKFVSTVGAAGIVSVLKEEVTAIVESVLVESQSGSYGVGEALRDNGYGKIAGKHIGEMSLEYVDFVFERSRMYQVEELPINGGIGFDKYMLGGLTVLFMMLSCLTFAPLYVRKDDALPRVLQSRRVTGWMQTVAEFGAYAAALTLLLAVIVLVLKKSGLLPETTAWWDLFVAGLPVLLMTAALFWLLFELSGNLITGILQSFFAALVLSFIGGCMYPAYFFPVTVQRLAAVLPTGIARERLTACFVGAGAPTVWPLFAYAGAFLLMAAAVRCRKTGKVRG